MLKKPRVILIAGPTASGKSVLAMSMARGGSLIVNADSMQVYRNLRILTARPTIEEEHLAPHRLYGHVSADINYSVGCYLRDMAKIVAQAADRPLIVVGGTGLYFKALVEGLSPIPVIPDAVRTRIRQETALQETPRLHAELQRLDSQTARRLHPNDRLRILRALEVWTATGQSLASFKDRRQPGLFSGWEIVKVFLDPDPTQLKRRIDVRFEAMMAGGALQEVEALMALDLDAMLPAMRAHGVPGLLAFLRGETSLIEAIARGQADTRHYAKRQFTWFRHQMPGWNWIAPEKAETYIAERLKSW